MKVGSIHQLLLRICTFSDFVFIMRNKFRINHLFKLYTSNSLSPQKDIHQPQHVQYKSTFIRQLTFIKTHNNIITDMSNKIKVRFNYGAEHTVLVNQMQKGPVDLNYLPNNTISIPKQQVNVDTLKQPVQITKEQLLQDNLHQIIKGAEKNVDAAQTKEKQILQNAILNTFKSQQNIPNIEPQASIAKSPKKETLKIEDLDEAAFHTNPQTLIQKPIQKKNDNPAIIAGPNFKSIGKSGKAVKQYTKIQNTANYEYTNIPVKDEDEFTGCFGCMRRKPKSYSIEKK